jgi:hypothetical protein
MNLSYYQPMLRIFTIVLCTCSLFGTYTGAQTTPTLTATFVQRIKADVKDSNSNFYYPKLLAKLKERPSEVNKADLFFLYYGGIFQPKHSAFGFRTSKNGRAFQQAAMSNDCQKTILLGKQILDEYPIDLDVLLHVNMCLKPMHEIDTTYFLENRFNQLLEAILSTGNGLTKETAIKVAHIDEEIILKGMLRFLGGKETLERGDGTAYSVWRKDGKALYFEDLWLQASAE